MAKVQLTIIVDEEVLNESLLENNSQEELDEMSLEEKVQQEMGWLKGISVDEIEAIQEENLPVVNENPEPSFELVEKFAYINGYRFESHEDHKEARFELVELLKYGKITEEEIEKNYEDEME